MKSDVNIMSHLQSLLADELAATHQYTAHYAMVNNWGYTKLAGVIMARAKSEMEHANELMERITYFSGVPDVAKLGALKVGPTIPTQLEADFGSELTAIDHYQKAIIACIQAGDDGTRVLLEHILTEEEAHANDIEAQREQIAQMGLNLWLSTQV